MAPKVTPTDSKMEPRSSQDLPKRSPCAPKVTPQTPKVSPLAPNVSNMAPKVFCSNSLDYGPEGNKLSQVKFTARGDTQGAYAVHVLQLEDACWRVRVVQVVK